jgi:glycerol-3-phosphate dehydrogenase
MAHTLSDVLARRTRAAILDREAAAAAASDVARLLGSELGWDEAERSRQVAAFMAEVEVERASLAASVRPVA